MKQKIMKTPFAINPKIKAPIVYTFASDQIGDKIYKRDNKLLIVIQCNHEQEICCNE